MMLVHGRERRIQGVNGRRKGAQQCEDDKDRKPNHCRLAHYGTSGSKVGPVAARVSQDSFHSIVAELVVDDAAKGDAVPEYLKSRHPSTPDDHRGDNEKNIFQHSA